MAGPKRDRSGTAREIDLARLLDEPHPNTLRDRGNLFLVPIVFAPGEELTQQVPSDVLQDMRIAESLEPERAHHIPAFIARY